MPRVADAAAGLHQQCVGVAVIAALKLQDPVALRERAGQADCAHDSLGATGDEAQLLDGWHGLSDQRGQIGLGSRRRAEAGASCRCGLHRCDDWRRGMAKDHGPP